MKNVFEEEGELREVDPLAALVSCWREKSSGVLRFERGAFTCGLDLEQGEVVGVSSSDPRFETAAILVRAGKLAADAVESLAPQGGDPALLALQTGLLTRREWKWGEKIRAIEVLSDLLSWEDGRYRFDSSAAPLGGDFRLPVPRLLLELFLRSRDRNLVDHQLGPPDQRLVRGELFETEFPTFGLTADAESVVHLIDGRSTAAEIAQKAPAEEFAVRKLLAALVTLGLVHPVPAAPPRPFERPTEEPEPEREEPFPSAPEFPEEPASGPESTAALEMPEEDASGVAPVDLPEPPVPPGASESEPEMVELPGAEASPLERFEPEKVLTPPWEEEPTPPAPERWESGEAESFPGAIESPEPSAPERRFGAPLAWSLGILFAAVVGVVLWRSRSGTPTDAAASGRPTVATAVTFPPPVTAARAEAPLTAAPAAAPSPIAASTGGRAAPTAAPTVAVRATAIPPTARPAPTAAPRVAEADAGARADWVKRADRDRKRLAADKKTKYAIQLELVCEVPSLVEAWRHDRGQSMWLLPVAHSGRDCFRVFWGRYSTLEAARKGKSAVPSYFTTARNRPAVVAVP